MAKTPSILFAGGGTGGHLYPSIAIAERVIERGGAAVHFACSNRPLDAEILSQAQMPFTPLGVRPFPRRPWHLPGFIAAYLGAVRQVKGLIRQLNVRCVVAMGGFGCAPAVAAGNALGAATVLVNLDATPGKANRWLAPRCRWVFTVYPSDRLPLNTQTIGLPLRRSAIGPDDQTAARIALGLEPNLPTLLITGASQGASSINRMMTTLAARADFVAVANGWQVLHLTGAGHTQEVEQAYRRAGLAAMVLAYCNQMGLAWRSADLAVSRAGAGSVAEVAANAVPAVFLPYPYHADEHQRHNAAPLEQWGGAVIVQDRIDAAANADHIGPVLLQLMGDAPRRQAMRDALTARRPPNGADQLADLLLSHAR